MAKRFQLLGLWLIGTAACSANSPPPPREPVGAVTSLREIAGAWDIASFDGYVPMRLHEGIRRAYVDIGPRGLSYTIECNYSGNPAHVDGTGILHDESGGSRMSTQMACGPEMDAREGAFYAFFASKPKVSRIGGGRIAMSNGRTTLILEKPEARRLANIPSLRELEGSWVPRMATRVLEGNGHEGWGFQEPRMLIIAQGTLRYSGCGGVAFSFRYTPDARMETTGESGKADCGTETPGAMLLRVLRNDPLVERTAGGGIALTAGNEVISLQSAGGAKGLRAGAGDR
jgi:heat shock protein HslJ